MKKEKYFRFMQQDGEYEDDIDYLWFRIWKFHFRWFIDCGEWFIYLEWWNKDRIKGFRLSSAGNCTLNFKRLSKVLEEYDE
jgi:hypothetical protein